MKQVKFILTLVAGLALSLGLASCGGSSSSSTTTTPTPVNENQITVGTIPVADRSSSGTSGIAPTVIVPTGTTPRQVEVTDLIVGTGPQIKAGDSVTAQYVLATYSSGKVVQSSWTSQPFTFTVGENQVIPGFDRGVQGMQAGGRREIIIPSAYGYGGSSPGPGIAANDTLIFMIDLVSINQ